MGCFAIGLLLFRSLGRLANQAQPAGVLLIGMAAVAIAPGVHMVVSRFAVNGDPGRSTASQVSPLLL